MHPVAGGGARGAIAARGRGRARARAHATRERVARPRMRCVACGRAGQAGRQLGPSLHLDFRVSATPLCRVLQALLLLWSIGPGTAQAEFHTRLALLPPQVMAHRLSGTADGSRHSRRVQAQPRQNSTSVIYPNHGPQWPCVASPAVARSEAHAARLLPGTYLRGGPRCATSAPPRPPRRV